MAQANPITKALLEEREENALLSTDGILTAIATAESGAVYVFSSQGFLDECFEQMVEDFRCPARDYTPVEAMEACGREFYEASGGTITFWFAPVDL